MITNTDKTPAFDALYLFFALAMLTCLVVGCGNRGGSAGSAATTRQQEAPKQIQDAFDGAKPEVRAEADRIAAAIQNQEAPKAFLQLQQLSARTDLTSEQSAAASRAMASVREQLAAASARGDKAATELLEMYRSTK